MRTAQIIRALSVATVVAVWGAAVAGAGKADGAVTAGAVQADAAQPASTPDRALLDRYCVTCHNARLKTAGLTLDDIDVANVGPRAEAWEKVLRKIRAGQMPPVGRPRPDDAAASAFMGALETALERASNAAPNPGRPTMHRLNRTEYSNSVRDLLALEIDGRSLLPADDTDEHGFDNNADVLTVSPACLPPGTSRRRARLAGSRWAARPPRPSRRTACRGSWCRTIVSTSACPSARAAAPSSITTSRPTASTSSRFACRPTTTTTSRALPMCTSSRCGWIARRSRSSRSAG